VHGFELGRGSTRAALGGRSYELRRARINRIDAGPPQALDATVPCVISAAPKAEQNAVAREWTRIKANEITGRTLPTES